MSHVDDGGPAFPSQELNHDGSPYYLNPGMSLRAYFAAKAMQGMLAVPDDRRYGDHADKALTIEEWQQWCVDGLVEHAYRVADALIAALKGGPKAKPKAEESAAIEEIKSAVKGWQTGVFGSQEAIHLVHRVIDRLKHAPETLHG